MGNCAEAALTQVLFLSGRGLGGEKGGGGGGHCARKSGQTNITQIHESET